MEIRVYRNDELVYEFSLVSGGQTTIDRSLVDRFGEWIVHTEPQGLMKILEAGIPLDEGTTILLKGMRNPCSMCDRFLSQVHHETGAEIWYKWFFRKRGNLLFPEEGLFRWDIDRLTGSKELGKKLEGIPELEDLWNYIRASGGSRGSHTETFTQVRQR